MKIKVAVTVELTEEQVANLSELAESAGFVGSNKRELIKNYLTKRVEETVYYSNELVEVKDVINEN